MTRSDIPSIPISPWAKASEHVTKSSFKCGISICKSAICSVMCYCLEQCWTGCAKTSFLKAQITPISEKCWRIQSTDNKQWCYLSRLQFKIQRGLGKPWSKTTSNAIKTRSKSLNKGQFLEALDGSSVLTSPRKLASWLALKPPPFRPLWKLGTPPWEHSQLNTLRRKSKGMLKPLCPLQRLPLKQLSYHSWPFKLHKCREAYIKAVVGTNTIHYREAQNVSSTVWGWKVSWLDPWTNYLGKRLLKTNPSDPDPLPDRTQET